MSDLLDVAIIGAGPYGLSIAAHLVAAGVEHRIFGTPMESWEYHMPTGMLLKSYGESSNLFDPESSFTLQAFCREKRLAYDPTIVPVKLENFIAYGKAFQKKFVPRVEPRRLIALTGTNYGHELQLDNGEVVSARRVVLAIGVVPFKYMPPQLTHLPSALVSHSSDLGPIDRLEGREVTVVGGGSSAIDIAALLSMRGATVTVVARGPKLLFQPPPGATKPPIFRRVLQRAFSPPSHGLGDGWLMRTCAKTPQLIHMLPDRLRSAILNNTLGPSGGYFVRDQIETKVILKLGRAVSQFEECGGRARLISVDRNGTRDTIDSDHIVAATGYRIDIRQLRFLSQGTLERLRMVEHTPILSSEFECSVPGLYFVGLAAARSFGPVLRFVMGAVHPARRLAKFLPRSLLKRPSSMSTAISN